MRVANIIGHLGPLHIPYLRILRDTLQDEGHKKHIRAQQAACSSSKGPLDLTGQFPLSSDSGMTFRKKGTKQNRKGHIRPKQQNPPGHTSSISFQAQNFFPVRTTRPNKDFFKSLPRQDLPPPPVPSSKVAPLHLLRHPEVALPRHIAQNFIPRTFSYIKNPVHSKKTPFDVHEQKIFSHFSHVVVKYVHRRRIPMQTHHNPSTSWPALCIVRGQK